jgi:hypothetical protein
MGAASTAADDWDAEDITAPFGATGDRPVAGRWGYHPLF